VVEAAGRAAIEQWAPAALAAAPEMIIASTSAFYDEGLLARLVNLAESSGSRIQIPSGAIGAIDALASAAVLDLEDVVHQIVKPPRAWKDTPAEGLIDLDGLTEHNVYSFRARRERPRQPTRRTPMQPSSPRWPASASTRHASRWSQIQPPK